MKGQVRWLYGHDCSQTYPGRAVELMGSIRKAIICLKTQSATSIGPLTFDFLNALLQSLFHGVGELSAPSMLHRQLRRRPAYDLRSSSPEMPFGAIASMQRGCSGPQLGHCGWELALSPLKVFLPLLPLRLFFPPPIHRRTPQGIFLAFAAEMHLLTPCFTFLQ